MLKITTTLLLIAAGLSGQTTAPPSWKEFSIGAPTRNGSRFGPEGFQSTGVPLRLVLSRAYGVPEHRIAGPEWIASERYALTALAANRADFQVLKQRELTARFYLMTHRETREVPVYVLRKLDGAQPTVNQAPVSRTAPGMQMPQATLTDFANSLADAIQRPVFNETGIDGRFDITLNWSSDKPATLPAAVKQQLGLELAEDKRLVELLVIDHIEKPQLLK